MRATGGACLKKSMIAASVSSGLVVASRWRATISPAQEPTAHTHQLPPVSTPPTSVTAKGPAGQSPAGHR